MSEIIEQTGGALALPADLMAELALAAKDAAAQERPKVAKISTKAGMLAYGGNPMPNNEMDVVIVGVGFRSALYLKPYNPAAMELPMCFAACSKAEGMAPHENVAEPMSTSCKACKYSAWESVRLIKPGDMGKGKACKESRRLVILPANQLGSAQEVSSADLAVLDIPPTSIANYSKLVTVLSAAVNRPAWAMVTKIAAKPHIKNQFELTFTPMRPAGDESIIRAIQGRMDEAMRIALAPYEQATEEAAPTVEEKPKKPAKF
jgi:hypothetical protein